MTTRIGLSSSEVPALLAAMPRVAGDSTPPGLTVSPCVSTMR